MKEKVAALLSITELSRKEIVDLIEIPKNPEMGDYALPTFSLAKKFKISPLEIAKDIAPKIKLDENFEKVTSSGAYVNFFVNREKLAKEVIGRISKEGEKYGSSKSGKGKKIVIEMSSPNIAKPFGIGHLRSTIIGNSLSRICDFQGFKSVKINYLGDWGTQFGKLIVGYKKFGKKDKLRKDPISHLLEIYVKANKEDFEDEARDWFRKLEKGDKEAKRLWKMFREQSLKNFEAIYKRLGVKFNVVSGESSYNRKIKEVISNLEKKKLLEESEGASIVNLEKDNLGVSLIKKKDGSTLYATRDIAAAIDRYNKYKFEKMVYEVGSEQNLHFKQFFRILELMGHKWVKNCVHVNHGLYLDKDGKKFATRKGKVVFMEEVLDKTIQLAKKEIKKREKLSGKALDERAEKIAIAAIFYGDLKNYRGNNIVFDIKRFLSFEGDTGPYLLYSYARAQSILRKAGYKRAKKFNLGEINENEKRLVSELGRFPEVAKEAYDKLAPNLIANYAYELAKVFSEFYHEVQVIGSKEEQFRLILVDCFSQTIKNALYLLGIDVISKM